MDDPNTCVTLSVAQNPDNNNKYDLKVDNDYFNRGTFWTKCYTGSNKDSEMRNECEAKGKKYRGNAWQHCGDHDGYTGLCS